MPPKVALMQVDTFDYLLLASCVYGSSIQGRSVWAATHSWIWARFTDLSL
jgi:hypothetical protein